MPKYLEKYFNKNLLIFFIVSFLTLVGLFFRIYKLDQLPLEMHRDELNIAYNGYSILQTKFDEHNKGPYPIVFESFGDYKLPMMIYLSAVSIYFFDLTVWAVRMPNVILSTLLIPLTYLFVREIFDKFKHKNTLGILSAFLLTFSYWHIFLSRTIYEPIAGLTFHILALFFTLKAKNNPIYFVLALILFIPAFFTYNLPLLLAPLLVLLMIFSYKENYLSIKNRYKTFLFLLIFFSLVLSFFLGFSSITSGKSQATILSNSDVKREISNTADNFFLAGANPILRRIYTHQYFIIVYKFSKNYLSTFDPNYLFFSGGKNPWHSLNNIDVGNIDPIYLLLVVFSIIYLVRLRKNILYPAFIFTAGYILLSPIPNSLTIDAPVTNRLMDFHYALAIFSSLGLYWLIFKLPFESKKLRATIMFCSFILFFIGFGNFLTRYFYLHSRKMDLNWHSGLRATMEKTAKIVEQYDRVYFDKDDATFSNITTPYIYFAFYHKYDPIKIQNDVVWIKDNDFHRIEELEPYYIKSIDENHLTERSESLKRAGVKNVLYITRISGNEGSDPSGKFILVDKVQNFPNDPIWGVYSYQVY